MYKSVLAAAVMAAAASAAEVQHPSGTSPSTQSSMTNHPPYTLAYSLSCFSFQVGGNAPSVQITNNGPGVVPAGTKAHWVVGASNGDYVFPAPVQVHQIVVLNGVARSGLGACSISILK